jgi:hypothetical protein
MTMLGSFLKQPVEVESYTINYSEYLVDGDQITSSSAFTDPVGLTVDNVYVEPPRVCVWLSGGTNNVTYKVTVTTDTADGRVMQDEFKVKVHDI